MSARNPRPMMPVERLALRKEEAARALGVSDETFDKYIRAHVPVLYAGSVRLYPVKELREYLSREASSPIDECLSEPAARSELTGGRRLRGP